MIKCNVWKCKYQFDNSCTLETVVIKGGICVSAKLDKICNDCGTRFLEVICPKCHSSNTRYFNIRDEESGDWLDEINKC